MTEPKRRDLEDPASIGVTMGEFSTQAAMKGRVLREAWEPGQARAPEAARALA